MLRILKLLAYGLLGYALYEFFRGLTQDVEPGARSQGGMGRQEGGESAGGARGEFASRMNVTGGGRGRAVESQEPDGGSVPRVVGRGVVS